MVIQGIRVKLVLYGENGFISISSMQLAHQILNNIYGFLGFSVSLKKNRVKTELWCVFPGFAVPIFEVMSIIPLASSCVLPMSFL